MSVSKLCSTFSKSKNPQYKTITVKEARKLLGKDAEDLSDDQIRDIINTLTLLAREYFHKASSKKALGI